MLTDMQSVRVETDMISRYLFQVAHKQHSSSLLAYSPPAFTGDHFLV